MSKTVDYASRPQLKRSRHEALWLAGAIAGVVTLTIATNCLVLFLVAAYGDARSHTLLKSMIYGPIVNGALAAGMFALTPQIRKRCISATPFVVSCAVLPCACAVFTAAVISLMTSIIC